MLTESERERYDRQIIIRGVGEAGQEKLKRAKIVIVGAGGLGSPISIYLAAAGVGTMRLIDHGSVELSNLNRQILHWDEDISRKKAISAAEKLRRLNPEVKVEALEAEITEGNATELVAGFDLIVDALDNLPTRYLLNKVAVEQRMPFFHGAVYGFEGRVLTIIPGKSACLRCIYKRTIPAEKFPVIGMTAALIGCIQAAEVIKYIVGLGELLTNRLLIYDGLNLKFTELEVARDPDCDHCGHLKE